MLKKFLTYKNLIFFLTALLFFNSCIQENPDLVNPPPYRETVRVRLINLASDFIPRQLNFDDKTFTAPVNYMEISELIKPPADSCFISIMKENNTEFKHSRKIIFSRSTIYTFFSLPSPNNSPNYRNVDTIIFTMTLTGLLPKPLTSYIKVINVFPDTTVSFSVALGCPNGVLLTSHLGYRMESQMSEIHSGENHFSIVKHKNHENIILDLFKVELKTNNQYALIILQNKQGQEEVLLLDEFDGTIQALKPVTIVPQRYSQIRTINLTNKTINSKKEPDEDLIKNLQPMKVSEYKNVSACNSNNLDTFLVSSDNQILAETETSLMVAEKYTLIAFDSANITKLIIAEPIQLFEERKNRSTIRVVNISHKYPGLRVSLGARTDKDNPLGYTSGEILASESLFGTISPFVLLKAGFLPISVFTSAQPSKLLFTTIARIDENKNYLLIVSDNPNNTLNIAIVEENEENENITFLEEAVFFEFVHLTPGINNVTISIPPIIDNAKVFYSSSISTIIPKNTEYITIQNNNFPINPEIGKRLLTIATGDKQNIDLYVESNFPMVTTPNAYNRRFINACKERKLIRIRLDCETCFILADSLAYKTSSFTENVPRESKYSLFFQDPTDKDKFLKKVSDISPALGKNYIIIFGGSQSSDGYTVVIQQEF